MSTLLVSVSNYQDSRQQRENRRRTIVRVVCVVIAVAMLGSPDHPGGFTRGFDVAFAYSCPQLNTSDARDS